MISVYPPAFARFYDTIYHHMRDDVDNEYFQNLIRSTKGKALEIGVGTGRLFMNALNQGADIHGLDISPSMLEILFLKINKDQHYRITKQNIIDFKFDFRFYLIIAPFRVIMHLLDKEDQIKAINNVYNHLNSNGKFVFDVFVPDLKQLINGINNQMDFEGEYAPGLKLRRIVSTVPDLISQTIEVNFHLEWEDGNELKEDNWKVPLRFFFRFELEHLIERTRFESYKIYGDYAGSELNKDSKEFVVVCQKR